MLIIPAIDLRQGKCVRLAQGRRSDVKIYGDDPVALACDFEAQGAQMLHVVNLDGAFDESDSLNRKVAQQIIRAVGIPVQLGGGLRSADAVEQLIQAGAARVVVGTMAVEALETLEHLTRRFGNRIAVGIDAKDGLVKTRGWEKDGNLTPIELARRVAGVGVERVIYTDIARDGMLDGVNVGQTCALARESGLKVTASGGISSLENIKSLVKVGSASGVDSVIVGRAIYEGRFTVGEALQSAGSSSVDKTLNS